MRQCRHCGSEFEPRDKKGCPQQFCTDRCRVRQWNVEHPRIKPKKDAPAKPRRCRIDEKRPSFQIRMLPETFAALREEARVRNLTAGRYLDALMLGDEFGRT